MWSENMARQIRRFGPAVLLLSAVMTVLIVVAGHPTGVVSAAPPAVMDPVLEPSSPATPDVCPDDMEGEGVFPCAGPCFCDEDVREPTDPVPPGRPPVTGTPTTVPGSAVTNAGAPAGPVITPRLGASAGSVNVHTGEFHWALPLPTYRVPGPRFGTNFWLVYRSQMSIDGVTGNWDVTFNQRLRELQPGGDIECLTGTGRVGDIFVKSGGSWTAPAGWNCELSLLTGFGGAGASFRLTEDGGTYREYDADGYLVLIGDADGNSVQFTRSATSPHEVTSITDDTGRTSTLSYAAGRLTSFQDPTGAITSLAYNASGQLESVTTPAVSFVDSSGTSVTRGIVTSFSYSSGHSTGHLNGNLLEIRDDSGAAQITNAFDASDRVETQENALGGIWGFTYFAGQTSLTLPSGYEKLLDTDNLGRITRIEELTATGMGRPALRRPRSHGHAAGDYARVGL